MKAPQKFFPGDKVVFTGPYLYGGEIQPDGKFQTGVEYEVLDHSEWQDQWDRKGKPHVILQPKGRNSFNWVDEDCLELALPPASDEEVEAALKSIASAVKGV